MIKCGECGAIEGSTKALINRWFTVHIVLEQM